jgi:hypothetical protein
MDDLPEYLKYAHLEKKERIIEEMKDYCRRNDMKWDELVRLINEENNNI